MLNVIKSEDRYHADFGWLDTRWHFSFSEYYDPENLNWGPLRVFNDDVVHGGGGFPRHPHRDMEIVSYVLQGQLEHQDHLGNRGVVRPGEVQVMSAGKGIMHSEYNHSKTEDVHFLQLWITPRNKNLPPRWEQKLFSPEARRGKLLPVVSDGSVPGTLAIDQDAVIYVSSLRSGERVVHSSTPARHAYLFVIDGAVNLNGTALSKGDQARLADEPKLTIEATADAELILLDLP